MKSPFHVYIKYIILRNKGGESMRKILYNRKFWFLVITSLIILLTLFVYKNLDTFLSNWFDTVKLLFGIIGLITTLFNYWKKFNLFITRIWIILSNSTSIWNVTASFEGQFDQEILKKIYKKIREKAQVSDYYSVNDNTFKITVNGLNYTFEYQDTENEEMTGTKGKLLCRITDFNSSYDYSIKIFEDDIIPYFRIIENESRPEDKIYNFKISFKGKNPFIKLITKNVDTKSVNSLWYTYNEDTKVGRRDVKVTSKSLECTTTDITDFQYSSINFISLVGE